MIYQITFSPLANEGIKALKRSEPLAFKKVMQLIQELQEHPTTGTGKPEPLKGNRLSQWSRRISQKHRLIYEIREEIVTVLILSSYGHYDVR